MTKKRKKSYVVVLEYTLTEEFEVEAESEEKAEAAAHDALQYSSGASLSDWEVRGVREGRLA